MQLLSRELITRSLYLSGIVPKEFAGPTDEQISSGLFLLNSFLAVKSSNTALIPYYEKFLFNAVIGQESYFIDNLCSIATITFFLDVVVRFSMDKKGRTAYFGSSRVENISALPFNWHQERVKGGTQLYLYFLPDDTFPIEIYGKFSFAPVTLDQDLSLKYDHDYLTYLRYGLAKYICDENRLTFPAASQLELDRLESFLRCKSPPDLKMKKISSIDSDDIQGWPFINLSQGWVP